MPRRSFISFFTFRKNLGPSGNVFMAVAKSTSFFLATPVLGDVVSSLSLAGLYPSQSSIKKSSTTESSMVLASSKPCSMRETKSDFIASASSAVTEPSASNFWR